MFKKILVPVDGSDSSVMAAQVAMDLAGKNEGKITLLYVVRPFLFQYGIEDAQTPEPAVPASAIKSGQEILRRIQEKIAAPDATLLVEIGTPAQIICSQANDGEYDLIVMGSRGITGLTESLIGSVSQNVSHRAHCPVFLTRLPKGAQENHTIIKSMPEYNIYL